MLKKLIAECLGTTVEYLVTGKNDNTKQSDSLGIELPLCKKYYSLIKKFETLQEESVKQIEALIKQIKKVPSVDRHPTIRSLTPEAVCFLS